MIFGYTYRGIKVQYRKDGNRVTDEYPFDPYFYVLANAPELRHPDIVRYEPSHRVTLDGRPVKRIVVTRPGVVPTVRELFIEHFEANVPFLDRAACDLRLQIHNEEAVRCYWDCETTQDYPILDRRNKLLSIQVRIGDKRKMFYWHPTISYSDDVLVHCADEKGVIYAFFSYLNTFKPEIIAGWNSQGFDTPTIQQKSPFPYLEDCLNVDLLPLFKAVLAKELESFSLDYVSKFLGLGGKVELASHETPHYLWANNFKKFVEYGFKDVDLCKQIDEKKSITDLYLAYQRVVGTTFDSVLQNSTIIDNLMLQNDLYAYPTHPNKLEVKKKRIGGRVILPKRGLTGKVFVIDMKSEYPTIMIAKNISPDTLYYENGVAKFRQDFEGLVPKKLKMLAALRAEFKKRAELGDYKSGKVEQAAKRCMNSFTGVFGYFNYRLYNVDIFNEVTSTGQAVSVFAQAWLEARGVTVLGGDTDSLFINKMVDLKEFEQAVTDFIIEKYGAKPENCHISFGVDEYEQGFFGTKKRYVLKAKDGSMEIVGFEYIRSDAAPVTKRVQKEVFRMMFEDKLSELPDFILRLRKEFNDLPLMDIAIPRHIKMKLNEYKTSNPWIDGYQNATDKGLDVSLADSVKILYVENPYKVIAITKEEDAKALGLVVNREIMFDKTVLGKLQNLEDFFPFKVYDVYTPKKFSSQRGLEEFVSGG